MIRETIISKINVRSTLPQLAVLGSMRIGGTIIGSDNLGEYMQTDADSGAKQVILLWHNLVKCQVTF